MEETWARIRRLFEGALEVKPAERLRWLAERASEDTLAEVRGLLAADAAADSPLDHPEASLGLDLREGEAEPEPRAAGGERIGPFLVQGVLGEGRTGVVYQVLQDRPRREAALKLLRSSVRRTGAAARFETEVRALARLSDPGIAAVYEVGELPEPGGAVRPYLLMELVDGARPITAVAEEAPRAQRLALLESLCEAVAHAHQRGVLHRDLKPGNVLVDAAGRLKVIDFGIARLLEEDGTRATMTGQLLGTPAYMSPEQAAGREADTRSDVHAIGLIARELMGADAQGRADLAVVVRKATAEEPAARYQSVGELGAELGRVRRGEPILARPPGVLTVFRSWVRRRKAWAAATAAMLLAAVGGVTALTVSAARLAESWQESRETAAFLADNILAGMEDKIGAADERRKLAEQLLPRLERLALRADDDWLRGARARVLMVLGGEAQARRRTEDALVYLARALTLRQELCDAAPGSTSRRADLSIAFVRVGDVLGDMSDEMGRRARYEAAMTIDRELVARSPNDPVLRTHLAYSCERLGSLALRRGDVETAIALTREQKEIATALLAEDPDDPSRMWDLFNARSSLGAALSAAGRRSSAHVDDQLQLIQEVLKVQPSSRAASTALMSLLVARAAELAGPEPVRSLADSHRAEAIARRLAEEDPNDWHPGAWRLRILLARLDMQLRQGRAAGAFENAKAARDAWQALERMAGDAEEVWELRREVAARLGPLLTRSGEDGDALVRQSAALLRIPPPPPSPVVNPTPPPPPPAARRLALAEVLRLLDRPTEGERAERLGLLWELAHQDDPAMLLAVGEQMLVSGDRQGAAQTADRVLDLCSSDQTLFIRSARGLLERAGGR